MSFNPKALPFVPKRHPSPRPQLTPEELELDRAVKRSCQANTRVAALQRKGVENWNQKDYDRLLGDAQYWDNRVRQLQARLLPPSTAGTGEMSLPPRPPPAVAHGGPPDQSDYVDYYTGYGNQTTQNAFSLPKGNFAPPQKPSGSALQYPPKRPQFPKTPPPKQQLSQRPPFLRMQSPGAPHPQPMMSGPGSEQPDTTQNQPHQGGGVGSSASPPDQQSIGAPQGTITFNFNRIHIDLSKCTLPQIDMPNATDMIMSSPFVTRDPGEKNVLLGEYPINNPSVKEGDYKDIPRHVYYDSEGYMRCTRPHNEARTGPYFGGRYHNSYTGLVIGGEIEILQKVEGIFDGCPSNLINFYGNSPITYYYCPSVMDGYKLSVQVLYGTEDKKCVFLHGPCFNMECMGHVSQNHKHPAATTIALDGPFRMMCMICGKEFTQDWLLGLAFMPRGSPDLNNLKPPDA